MKRVLALLQLLIIFVSFVGAFNLKQVRAWTGTVSIRVDGTIDPPTAPITTYDKITYTLTDNITSSGVGINVERDNVVIDGNRYTLRGALTGSGIDVSYRTNVTIRGINIIYFENGIFLHYSSGINISGNNITDHNVFGIRLESSSNNSISGNNIASSILAGIFLCISNLFTDDSSNNTISGNNIANNYYGLYFSWTFSNSIYHNNFVNNGVSFLSEVNIWDDGYPSGGNYWGKCVDVKSGLAQDVPGSDGIGDKPYIINVDNQDNYPLAVPFGSPLPPRHALTITATTGGATTPNPETYSYTENSSVPVAANASAYYLFDYWELDGIKADSSNSCSVYMDKNHALKAVFSLILHLDLNNDGIVNMLDLILVSRAFATFPSDPNYNPSADINHDGKINILDMILVATHLGQH